MLSSGKVDDSLNMITKMMINNNDKKLKKLEMLYNYLVDIIPYQLRNGILLPEPPEGLTYRHLGTMEHNICDILAQRMKGRKMSWSVSGAQNLAKILAEKASHRIYDILDEISGSVITN